MVLVGLGRLKNGRGKTIWFNVMEDDLTKNEVVCEIVVGWSNSRLEEPFAPSKNRQSPFELLKKPKGAELTPDSP